MARPMGKNVIISDGDVMVIDISIGTFSSVVDAEKAYIE